MGVQFPEKKHYVTLEWPLSRCTRCLVQKHAKKQHLYIKNYNSGPNMTTSASLTFFTAIFLALSGALAEELMVMCRHVTTELYIDIWLEHLHCL